MPRIFISYRRADSRTIANRIYDRLALKYGKKNVFKDVDDIAPGTDFRGVLREAASSCDVMLVIIGQKWASISDDSGNRRLFDRDDFVRLEVEAGLQRGGTLVIPVLVNGAAMPTTADLPETLHQLAFRNAYPVRDDPDFHHDMDRLVSKLGARRFAIGGFDWKWAVGVVLVPVIVALIPVVFPMIFDDDNGSPQDVAAAVTPTSEPTEDATATFTPSDTATETIPPSSPSPTTTATATVTSMPEPSLTLTPTIAPPTATNTAAPSPTTQGATFTPTTAPSATFQSQNVPASEPGTVFDPITGHTTAFVPEGAFEDANGSTVAAFWIDAYEVTNALFLEFVRERGWQGSASGVYYNIDASYAAISIDTGTFRIETGRGQYPVTAVTWIGAAAYCEWVGGRLPTATEWHKAAVWNPATGLTTAYPWGDAFNEAVANIEGTQLLEAGSFPTGMSAIGAYDMLGNVAEWTSNARGINRFYVGSSYADSWRTVNIGELQQATESFQSQSIGFRCVFDD